MLSWGGGSGGQLGYGGFAGRGQPTRVQGLQGHTVVAVAAGRSHSVLVDADGAVLTCGCNLYGRLGLGDAVGKGERVPVPQRVETAAVPVRQVRVSGRRRLARVGGGAFLAAGCVAVARRRLRAESGRRRCATAAGRQTPRGGGAARGGGADSLHRLMRGG